MPINDGEAQSAQNADISKFGVLDKTHVCFGMLCAGITADRQDEGEGRLPRCMGEHCSLFPACYRDRLQALRDIHKLENPIRRRRAKVRKSDEQ